jgi:endonuclease-3
MVQHSAEELEQVIYPVGFYRNKAKSILAISQQLIDEHHGQVPDDLDTLLALPGVGRKTANLVVTAGFGKPGICVDIHVHRISNRWGYIDTKTPEKTEFALREKLPQEYWLEYNGLLVSMGQNLCTPTSPWCSKCPLTQFCERVGVTRSR